MEILSMPKVLRLGVIEGTETKNLVEEEKKKQIEQPHSPRMMMMEERQEVEETEEKEKSEPNIKSASWLVKIDGGSTELIFKVVSEKGGLVVKKVPVKL